MSPTPRPSTLDRVIDVRSQLVRAVLAYLLEEAKSACELPVYFPERLRAGPPFGRLRQRVRVTDRAALERWQARQQETDPYAANRPRSQDTLDWDDDVADHFTRAIVLGEPGAGKSWLLRYDAWRIATASAADFANRRIGLNQVRVPVRVHLAELLHFLQRRLQRADRISHADTVRDALADLVVDRAAMAMGQQVPATFRPWVIRTLETARCVVLLDALDEVALDDPPGRASSGLYPTGRNGLGEYLAKWSRRFPDVHVRVTVRDAGYQRANPPLPNAPELVLLALEEADIEKFATAWFALSEGASAADFLGMLKTHEQMRGLSRNPLMLALMCRVREQRTKEFPVRRVEFYDGCVRGLLREWKEEDKKQVIPVEVVEASIDVLSYVAVKLLPQNPPYEEAEVSRFAQEAVSELPAGALPVVGVVQRFKQDGLLVPVSPRPGAPVLFLHRTVQEYLAGIGLVAPGVKAASAGPDRVAPAAEIIVRSLHPRIAEASWREAILLGLGYVAVTQTRITVRRDLLASAAIEAVLDQNPAPGPPGVAVELMGAVVAELPGAVTPHCVEAAQRRLMGAMLADRSMSSTSSAASPQECSPIDAKVRAACGDALARLGDQRFHGADRWYLPNDVACGFAQAVGEDRLGFVGFRAGEVLMGSDKTQDPDASDDELPQHRVRMGGFWIARWPVTVAQFRLFVKAGYDQAGSDWAGGLPNHPVANVSWYDADRYCKWLTWELRRHVHAGRLPDVLRGLIAVGWHVDLPTEAEWEYAARGKTAWIYPWGNEPDPDKANYRETGIGKTSAVGCFPAGGSPHDLLDKMPGEALPIIDERMRACRKPLGVEETAGNVREWTRSGYKKYPYDPRDGREEPPLTNFWPRVVRGGAFSFNQRLVRVASRLEYGPALRDGKLGFRVMVCPKR